MRLGFLGGKPILAYNSVSEALTAQSCLTCGRYREDIPCKYYADCRAGKRTTQPPLFYTQASDELIDSRLTTIYGDIKWI